MIRYMVYLYDNIEKGPGKKTQWGKKIFFKKTISKYHTNERQLVKPAPCLKTGEYQDATTSYQCGFGVTNA